MFNIEHQQDSPGRGFFQGKVSFDPVGTEGGVELQMLCPPEPRTECWEESPAKTNFRLIPIAGCSVCCKSL